MSFELVFVLFFVALFTIVYFLIRSLDFKTEIEKYDKYLSLLNSKIDYKSDEFVGFKKGDKVTAFGTPGVVKGISTNGMFVEVAFEGAETTVIFTIEGKVHPWNKEASLKPVTE